MRFTKDSSVSKSISKTNSLGETNWLLDGDELDEADDDTDLELSRHERQPNRGLFTHFDDPHDDDEILSSPTESQMLFPPDQQFSQEEFELSDYYPGATASAYEGEKRTYTCFYLSAAAIALLIASLGISLWWSVNHDDVSGGFGMGSYMLAVSSVIIAISTYMHRQDCRCWTPRHASPL
ncbi:uncharacterized protein GGS22DRAFT_134205 [Annulohypoxylon maeteangense]|uniref:uncharacterized protein n=1 Tax=Annulohypoxylon maeteangense TaxID=1927788 RepID=UPI002007CBEA|nr:uncharacterized protein GGS22DRAFT_134205 [Annulohypoxylon maeteangense]KAI0885759.1 hypothetical protein GGS22DRAFT_134205 [Annulohypoxylon maeteangense]